MSRPRIVKRPPLKATYNVDEAALLMRVDVATVYRACRDGRLRWRPGVNGRRVVATDVWALLRWGPSAAVARAHARTQASAQDAAQ